MSGIEAGLAALGGMLTGGGSAGAGAGAAAGGLGAGAGTSAAGAGTLASSIGAMGLDAAAFPALTGVGATGIAAPAATSGGFGGLGSMLAGGASGLLELAGSAALGQGGPELLENTFNTVKGGDVGGSLKNILQLRKQLSSVNGFSRPQAGLPQMTSQNPSGPQRRSRVINSQYR